MINILACPYGNSMPHNSMADVFVILLTLLSVGVIMGFVYYVIRTYEIDKKGKLFLILFTVFWIITMALNIYHYEGF